MDGDANGLGWARTRALEERGATGTPPGPRYWVVLLATAWAGVEATCLPGLAALGQFRRIEVVAA